MSDLTEALGHVRRNRLPIWRTRDLKTRVLFGAIITLIALIALADGGTIVFELTTQGERWVNRMFLFWGWSRFLHQIAPPALIYDPHALYRFELGLPGARPKDLPFAYPPPSLLLIWPLGLMRPVVALLAWSAAGFGAYGLACWRGRGGWRVALLAAIAPSTLVALYYAQNSLLVAALLIGGCRLLGRRPALGGVLFGLMIVKPQFALLLPVALIAARQWRAIFAAGATVTLMCAASVAAFGLACWTRLPAALAGLAAVVAHHRLLDHLAPTITGGMRVLGVGADGTRAAQVAAMLAAAGAVWFAWRRGPSALAVAALMVGGFLATPYAFLYDLPMLTFALQAVIAERHDSHDGFATWEILVLIAAALLPVLMLFQPLGAPWGMAVPAALFALILRRVGRQPAAPLEDAGGWRSVRPSAGAPAHGARL